MTDKMDRQIELEAESLGLGARRYRSEVPMPWRTEASKMKGLDELPPGHELVRRVIPAIANHLDEYFDAVAAGKAGRKHRAASLIADVDTIALAYIAARVAVSSFSHTPSLQSIMVRAGQQVQDHIQFSALADEKPRLLKYFENTIGRTSSAATRARIMRDVSKFTGGDLEWTASDKFRVGEKLILAFVEVTGLAEIVNEKAKRNVICKLLPTEETKAWLERAHARCELMSPMHMPMIVEPKPWTNPMDGGYYTLRRFLVKADSAGYRDELFNVEMPLVYDSLNAVQNVGWRINAAVLDTVAALWDSSSELGGLPRRDDEPLPAKPWVDRDPTKEELEEWKQRARPIYANNARLESKRFDLVQKIWIAEKFRDEEVLYFPHQLDFRGRVYPMVGTLNPQSNDVGKAMLEFSEGKPLGEWGGYWLAVHIANLFGVDKVSLDERVAWVESNSEALLDSAMQPCDGERFWTTADKPFCALAACFEWAGFQIEGAEFVSHLPIALDGSCSGLQHFSAMLRDSIGGTAVNLVPSDEPGDIYTRVAEKVETKLAEESTPEAEVWRGKVSRAIVKRPAMTFAYSATRFGMGAQIEDTLKELDDKGTPYLEGADNSKMAVALAPVVHDSIRETVVAASDAMEWLKDCARLVSKTKLPLRWTTPVGFPVVQDYRRSVSKRLAVFFGGRRIRLSLAEDTEVLDAKKQASGVSPNFVHSLDAAHLMMTTLRARDWGIDSIAVIHDSFGTHACDTDALFVILRQTFIEQYREDVLARFLEEVKEQLPERMHAKLPPLPPTGDLDIEKIADSDFCFA